MTVVVIVCDVTTGVVILNVVIGFIIVSDVANPHRPCDIGNGVVVVSDTIQKRVTPVQTTGDKRLNNGPGSVRCE